MKRNVSDAQEKLYLKFYSELISKIESLVEETLIEFQNDIVTLAEEEFKVSE